MTLSRSAGPESDPAQSDAGKSFAPRNVHITALFSSLTTTTSMSYYIGVDVGTGSARASLVKQDGTTVASCTKETLTFRNSEDHRIFEQSTNDIWEAISTCIRTCLSESKVAPSAVKGLGFDATCSLAVTDAQGEPITVTSGESLGKPGDRNVILWADHRAEEEADLINSTGSVVLDYVGGTMSVRIVIWHWL